MCDPVGRAIGKALTPLWVPHYSPPTTLDFAHKAEPTLLSPSVSEGPLFPCSRAAPCLPLLPSA